MRHAITTTRFADGWSDTQTKQDCPFWSTEGCKIKHNIPCRYGLTEVKVPKACPLRQIGASVFVVLKEIKGEGK